MGARRLPSIVPQDCYTLISSISLHFLNVIYEYSCLVKCNVVGSLPLDRGAGTKNRGRAGRLCPRGEAKPAELGFSGTNSLVGLRETPAGLSAAMRERYPDIGSTLCGFDAQVAPSG